MILDEGGSLALFLQYTNQSSWPMDYRRARRRVDSLRLGSCLPCGASVRVEVICSPTFDLSGPGP